MKISTHVFLCICCIGMLTSISQLQSQWKLASNSMGSDGSFCVEGDKLYVVTNAGLLVSNDEGSTWNTVNIPTTNIDAYGFVSNGTDRYVAMHDGIFYTSDMKNWKNVTPSGSVVILSCVTANSVFVISDGSILRSDDKGQNWKGKVSGLDSKKVNGVSLVASVLYCATKDGGIYKSTDNAENWILQANTGAQTYITAFRGNESNIYTEGGTLLRSTDAKNWTNVGANDGHLKSGAQVVVLDSLVIAISNGVYASADNGLHWVNVGQGLEANPYYQFTLSGIVKGSNAFLGTDAGFVLTRPLAEIAALAHVTASGINDQSQLDNLQVHPNPCTDFLTVELEKSGVETTIELSDLMGHVVQSVGVNKPQCDGSSIELNVSHLPSGLYTLKCGTPKSTLQKLVLIVH